MAGRFVQSWHLLAQILQQRQWLDASTAEQLAQAEPAHSSAWLQLFLLQNDRGLSAGILADSLAEYWQIKRAQLNEWQNAGASTMALNLSEWPQGVVWLGGQPACVGIVDASDAGVLQRLQFLINQPFEWRILSVDEYRFANATDVRFAQQSTPAAIVPTAENEDLLNTHDAPVVRYIHDLMAQMVRERASDIHFEPFATHYRIRARIDGMLHEIATPDISLKEQLSVRLKVMAHLDIAEKRVPQDGRIKFSLNSNQAVDCRVSTLPTLFGEKIVVRFLNSHSAVLDLSTLGYEPTQQAALENVLTHPHGLVLMTGPTGSGKTVSLYACLERLNHPSINISTVEDPVEIFMQGINQVSINEKAGIDFATVLRAFLRQDPDVLMVGEVRDLETADIALKAAQTGHLVFSTLHTNDAPLALTRLSQMGVTPYNIAASVSLIAAQRLVRTLCSCKIPKRFDAAVLIGAGFSEADAVQADWQAFAPNGCERCHHTGYLGRIGVFQILPISSNMQSLIAQNADAQTLRAQAAKEGVLTLRQAGLLKVKAGQSSLDEVMAATL